MCYYGKVQRYFPALQVPHICCLQALDPWNSQRTISVDFASQSDRVANSHQKVPENETDLLGWITSY